MSEPSDEAYLRVFKRKRDAEEEITFGQRQDSARFAKSMAEKHPGTNARDWIGRNIDQRATIFVSDDEADAEQAAIDAEEQVILARAVAGPEEFISAADLHRIIDEHESKILT